MKPAPRVVKMGEIPLSGESLTELMREVMRRRKSFRFRARGLSMSPFIKDGDVLTVVPLAGSGPKRGDVVAFVHPDTGKVAVHRVLRAGPGLFFIKGDNVADADGRVPFERLLGVVASVERAGGRPRAANRCAGAVIASLSGSGLLTKALGTARRVAGRRGSGRP